jgi:hypothetical protein
METGMDKHSKQVRRKKAIVGQVIALIIGIIASLIAAIIIATFPSIAKPIHDFVLAYLGWLIAYAVLILLVAIGLLYFVNTRLRERETWSHQLANLNSKLETLTTNLGWSDQLLEIVHKLLANLPMLVTTNDFYGFMHELLADATEVITNTVSGVYGASLYLPHDKDYLKIWVAYQVPEDSRKNALCYIGSNTDIKRGVAGECFCEKTTLVAHKTNQVDKSKDLIFDRESYLHFGKHGTHPAFESFICAPVVAENGECLGVLCFDSVYLTVFNNVALQKAIEKLGHIIAHLINLHETLTKKKVH